MKYITEATLRDEYKKAAFSQYLVKDGERLTPSALTFLNERKILILVKDANGVGPSSYMPPQRKKAVEDDEEKYVDYNTGNSLREKPEHMTHLHGNCLVDKTHPRIAFRGQIDSFIAECCAFQWRLPLEYRWLREDLEETIELLRKILRSDVTGELLEVTVVLGMDEEKLRAFSHYPKIYFGIGHIRIHYSLGETVLGLNQLRARIREAELSCAAAFEDRADIGRMMNRLSSLIYIMMLRVLSGKDGYPPVILPPYQQGGRNNGTGTH